MTLTQLIWSIAVRVLCLTTFFFLLTTIIFLITTVVFARKSRKGRSSDNPSNEKSVVDPLSVQSFDFDAVLLQNQGKREYQQDSFYLSDKDDKAFLAEKGLLAVVADGMGGLQDGKAISNLTVETFKNQFCNGAVADPQQFLTECVYKAEANVDAHIYESSMKGGSTVVAALIQGRRLNYVSVGDSSIFLVRNNKVVLLNRYHNYADVLRSKVRQGLITKKEADTDPMRSRITSFIGMGEVNEIDQNAKPISLCSGDVLILCSDGVANALGNDAILNLIQAGSFTELGSRIEKSILYQNIKNQDNFTAVMIKCNDF